MRMFGTTLWLMLAVVVQATAASLLLIVGHVTSDAARILYDQVPLNATQLLVRIYSAAPLDGATDLPFEMERQLAIDLDAAHIDRARPNMLTLHDLHPNRQHLVAFRIVGHPEEDEQVVRFRTSRDGNDKKQDVHANRVLVVSCDRFVDDRDSTLWHRIAQDMEQHAPSFFGMAHIGDQVYVDAGPDRVQMDQSVAAENRSDASWVKEHYLGIVNDFRRVYRETFGRDIVQQVLRTGAHWMLPDDHEIINNVNAELVHDVFGLSAQELANETEADTAKRFALDLHYRAGLQVMYEFQYQLQRDVAWGDLDFLHDPLGAILARYPLYYDVEIEHLKLYFMDVRFDRSFSSNPEEAQLLITHKQTQDFLGRMDVWRRESKQNAAVVLAGMPLFFHSPLTARLAYNIEREMYPGFDAQRRGLEELFHLFQSFQQAPNPLLKLLIGGDAHTLVHSRVCGYTDAEETTHQCLDQLITSGVTVGSTAMNDTKLMPFYYWITRLQPLVDRASSLVKGVKIPWTLETDRLYFGRNYGIVELGASGNFTWSSGIAPHEDWKQVMIQWTVDYALLPSVIATCGALLLVAGIVIRIRRRQHAKED